MYRIIIAIALSLSFIFVAKVGVNSLQSGSVQEAPVKAQKQGKPKDPKRSAAQQTLQFYPSVPSPLPDLYSGYLFNEERFLQKEEDKEKEGPEDENGTDLAVNMETVFYTGSIIIGNLRKGLIAYSPFKTTPVSRIEKGKRPSARQKSIKYAQLVAGDSLSGYKVVSVEADRIVFKKGPETLEKMLYDSEKKRIAPPPLPKDKVIKKRATASTSKKKRVELGKTQTSRRKVQLSPTVSSSKKKSPIKPQVRIPGIPPRP